MSDVSDAVKSVVRDRLKNTLRGDVQEIMNQAIETTLDQISNCLVVKFVSEGNSTFSVEFTWKNPDTDKESK